VGSRKLKFILSDLHLGAGYAGDQGNPLEDFAADAELVRFLREITRESESEQRDVELIINGDFFEFLQVPAVDHFDPHTLYPTVAYLDSSEAGSIKRLKLIIKGHQEVINALSDFMHVERPQRRITVIKGNHDVNLYWPRVKNQLREALGASGSRASLLLFAEKFVSRENIYVEHGHQQAEKMNCYLDHIDPRLPEDPTQLYYPLGSHFVINFFNEVEPDYWFVDRVKPLTALLWFALAWDFEFATKMLTSFVRHTPALAVRNYPADNQVTIFTDGLLQKLADRDKRQRIAVTYDNDPEFRRKFHRQIKQYLDDAALSTQCSSTVPELTLADDPVAIGRAEQIRQRTALRTAAEEIARREGAAVILFGHSHHPVYETLETGSVYLNTGCWLDRLDLSNISPQTFWALFDDQHNLEDQPRCLPYARLDYDENNVPTAQLLDFAHNNAVLAGPDHSLADNLARLLNRMTATLGTLWQDSGRRG
jgi:UDP-2,3-diacylglucosamine pyrophosphatase LpxH